MFTERDLRVQAEVYRDLLREAEGERLVQRVLTGRQKGDSAYRRALAWLGRQLTAWGKHLQVSYGNAPTARPARQHMRPGTAL
jgi:hypothetical protein